MKQETEVREMLKIGISLVITTLVVKYLKYKIGNLAILLYLAEHNIRLPNDAEIQKYTEKVVKKLFYIPS